MLGHLGADVGPAGSDLADRADQLGTGTFLGQIALGAGADGPHRVLLFLVHGENQDGQLGRFGLDLADQIDPAAPRHRQIEHEQVEAALAHVAQYLEAVDRFADDVDVGRAVENALESFAHDRVVVGNNYSDHRGPLTREVLESKKYCD